MLINGLQSFPVLESLEIYAPGYALSVFLPLVTSNALKDFEPIGVGFSLPEGSNDGLCQVAVRYMKYARDRREKDPRTAHEGVFRMFRREDMHLNLDGLAGKCDIPVRSLIDLRDGKRDWRLKAPVLQGSIGEAVKRWQKFIEGVA
ncbi:hypothetical protein C8R43DRAFT_954555 [Mycena crocata]|nr:hypothetical protein C8R43DRAFT_954555 [Mycena crocata]